jgi:hypothetical protein
MFPNGFGNLTSQSLIVAPYLRDLNRLTKAFTIIPRSSNLSRHFAIFPEAPKHALFAKCMR